MCEYWPQGNVVGYFRGQVLPRNGQSGLSDSGPDGGSESEEGVAPSMSISGFYIVSLAALSALVGIALGI